MFGRQWGVVCTVVLTLAITGPGVDARGDQRPADSRARGPSDTLVDVRPAAVTAAPGGGSHLDIINASAWHAAGLDGTGVTVGIIDFFDVDRYWTEAEHGPRPVAGVSAVCFAAGTDCTASFFDGVDEGGEDHGVAVVETVLDTAPGASILIGQAATVDDYQRLVDWFIERDVDVISRSLGSRYDGPGDGRGSLNDVVDTAVERGALWVNSAGNNGRNKYYRHQVRLSGDRVAFGPSGDETFLPFVGCVALGGVRWANDWDVPAADRSDYDVNLWESPTGDPSAGTIVARSEQRQRLGAVPIENIGTSHCPAAGSSLYLEVHWRGGAIAGDVLEILDYGSGIARFTSSDGSAAVSVVDSTNPGVLAVGAIDPADAATVAPYSSRGPSNDGRFLPDLTAAANIENSVQGRFAGTSAAAAVIAGAAALLTHADLAADPVAMADLIRHLTIDRGDPGPDNEYGHGEFRLPDPPSLVDQTPARFVSGQAPTRVLDTRAEFATGPPELLGEVSRGEIIELPMTGEHGVPVSGVTAVAISIVSVGADRPSHVQVLPTNAATLGGFSNLNIDAAGQTRANFGIVPVGADGSISIYSIADGHIVVDLLGWFEAADGAIADGRFVELDTAERLLDTRADAPITPIRSGDVRTVPMPSAVVPSEVAALVVTVTAAEPTGPGWLQAYPNDQPDVIARTSTVNTAAGGAVANTAIVPTTGGGMSITGFFADEGSSHVVVDAIGYITSSAVDPSVDGRYVAVRPGRAFDSRESGGQVGDGDVVDVDAGTAAMVPDSATGVMWNAAIVAATRPGFVRTWGVDGQKPETSSLNWTHVGEVRAAAVISPVDGRRARFEVEDGSADLPSPIGDLVVDVFGYFT